MWNKFEASSNEDESIGNTFFTNGLFKISNENDSVKDPKVLSSMQNKSIIIAVDKSLILLEHESTMDCKFVSFGAEIDCFAFSSSGNYIVCCLSDGNIHGVHVKGYPIFNTMIFEDDIAPKSSFVDIHLANNDFYLLCHNGKVYKIKGIEEEQFLEISNIDNDATCCLNESLIKTVHPEKVSNHRITSKVNSFCVVKDVFQDIFVICCDKYVTMIEGNEVFNVKNFKEGFIKKIYNIENYIIGLMTDGTLVEVCPFTKVLRKCDFSSQEILSAVDELVVLESNEDYIELLSLSSPISDTRQMTVVNFPSLNVKSELTLPDVSWVVSQPKSSINMYFIAGYKNKSGYLQSVELKMITEADPEERFKKLLLRGHFDEAESYAISCGIQLEPLNQARVKKTLMEMSVLRQTDEIEQKFEILMKQLEKIENKNYLISLRLSSDIPDRSCLTRFLEYLLQNIDTNKHPEETNEINELLLRLETLRLIDPCDVNMQWRKFLHQRDMLRVAMDYFKTDVLLSCLVWSRHATSIIPNMNLEKFYKWMDGMRSTIEPFQLIQFLKHFAPYFLQFYPDEMSRLVDWCISRTRALQFSPTWPEIGLEFINNIKTIFDEIEFLFIDIGRSNHYNIEKILNIIYILEEMVVLKKNYHLTLSFDDYSKTSPEEKGLRLLQRVQINNIKKLVNEFLYPIFMEQGLVPEETIVSYINFLAQNKNLGYWQERAVIAIDLLNNEENRLNCALLILKVSPVPWSDAVIPLAKIGTTSNHPLANLISIEHKNQAIKIIKKKYGWPVDYFDLQPDRLKLARRVMKVNNPEMIEDIKTLVKSCPDIKEDAYFYLFYRLVEVGRMDELVEFATSLATEENCFDVFDKTIRIFMAYIDEVDILQNPDDFIEVARFLLGLIKENMDEFKYQCHKKLIDNNKYAVQYRKEFKANITLKELEKPAGKQKWLDFSVRAVAQHITDSMSIDGMWSKVLLLSNLLKENRFKLYNLICQETNNIFVTCQVIDSLCQSEEFFKKADVKHPFELATLAIYQQIINLENNNYQLKQAYDPLTFPLAHELLGKCLYESNLVYHQPTLELRHWTDMIRLYYPRDIIETTRTERVINERVFIAKKVNGHSSNFNRRESFSVFENFEEQVNLDQIKPFDDVLSTMVECVVHAIKTISFVLNSNSLPYSLFRKFGIDLDRKPQTIRDEFSSSLESLLKSKLCMDAFMIMSEIDINQTKTGVIVLPQPFVTTVNKKMLKYMLSQKDPEYLKAFSIFRSENNKEDCMEYLKQSLRNNSQRISFSTFCEMYNQYKKNDKFKVDRESRLKLYYYSEICKSNPSLKSGVNLDNIGISDFLKDLEQRKLSVELIKKLSKDFDWNYQKTLVKQVRIVLKEQLLEFETRPDIFGNDEVVIKTTIDSIKKQCQPYIQEITDLPLLALDLENYFKEANDYFYELSLAVLDMMENCRELSMHHKLYRNILLLLKHKLTFKRRSINGEEYEYWQKTNHSSEGTVLPAISSWRLPFKMIVEGLPENVIGKDLNVDTFEIYHPLIQLHTALLKGGEGFDPNDRIEKCALSAAKNSVQDMRNQAEATVGAQWNLIPRNNAFLQTVKRMVGYLENKGKAIAILYFIVTNTPSGCDQMEAAHECWKFAMTYQDEILRSKYADVVDKAKRKYPLLKTQHLLYVFGLAEDRLLQLIENPRMLIHALYHHDSILQNQKKEINILCGELAELYNIDLVSIQVQLLSNWLALSEVSHSEETDANETVYEDFMGGTVDAEGNTVVSEENVIRAYYVLASWTSSTALDFLASEMTLDKMHTDNQLQLYECFLKLIDENSSTYLEIIDGKYVPVRVCHFLKILGFNMKPDKFETIDKIELLKKIWTSHNNNPKALEVMVLICLNYNIHLPQIWNGILKQMVTHKMVKQLSVLVETLSTKSKLLHLNNLKLAWEFVIQNPLIHATKIQSFEEDQKLSKALIALQKCPISTFLSLIDLAEKFIRLERPHMAAICIAFTKDPERSKIISMLSAQNKRELRKNIEYLEEFGIAPVVSNSAIQALNL